MDFLLPGTTDAWQYVPDTKTDDGFEWSIVIDFYTKYWYVFAFGGIAYLPTVLFLRLYMVDKEPYNLRTWKIFHNGALSVFSAIGGYYTTLEVIDNITSANFELVGSVCGRTWVHTPVGWWVFYFTVSKLFELPETIYICLEKKKLIFLHWYHHIATYLFCWYGSLVPASSGLYFCWMNFMVHAVMYFYYMLATINKKPPPWGSFVTTIQIVQMVVGVIVIWVDTQNCRSSDLMAIYGLAMYVSYFILFAHLFVSKYLRGNDKKKSRNGKDGGAKASGKAKASNGSGGSAKKDD